MDALSTPVSTIKAAAAAAPLLSAANPSNLLRSPPHLSSLPIPPSPNLSVAAKPHAKPLLRPSASPPRPRAPPDHPRRVAHRAASTGYAAALLDVARCDGALDAAERDARRLLRGVRAVLANPALDEAAKGAVVRGVAERGGFYRHLVALVRMLVGKGKVGMVGEVMEEFGRICDELSGTRVVVVVSTQAGKMEEDQLRGIAREVQRVSGAPKVKVRRVRMFAA